MEITQSSGGVITPHQDYFFHQNKKSEFSQFLIDFFTVVVVKHRW
jgi:hypothetical protein